MEIAEMNDVAIKLLEWEQEDCPKAPLTAKQREGVMELAAFFSNRPFPKSLKDDVNVQNHTSSENLQTEPTEAVGHLTTSVKIDTTHQFYEWFSHIERDMSNEEDERYRENLNRLKGHSKQCSQLLDGVNASLGHLMTLQGQYQFVSTKTNSLHEACEQLLAEQTKLANTAENIQDKLSYFLEVDKISQKLTSPTFSVANESYIPMLTRLDECILFLNANPNYKESQQYLVRFQHCLSKALSLINAYVVKSLNQSTQQVLPNKDTPGSLDNAFTLFYGKFRTNAPRIQSLMEQIETRVNNSQEYEQLLSDCHQCYFSQRDILIVPSVTAAINGLASNHQRDHCILVRSGCNLLLHLCEDEYQLFFHFFSKPSQQLEWFLDKLCTKMYDILRPLIIHINHLETLAELCTILKVEMLEEHVVNSNVRVVAFEQFATQLLQDVQERLVYRSQVYILSDILNYKPAPGDLAYPEKLEMMESITESLLQTRLSRTDSQTSLASSSSITSQEVAAITSVNEQQKNYSKLLGQSQADLHGMWYPTVRRTLSCLSKLYRCIDKSIFQGLSQEALSKCVQSLIFAGDMIAKNQTLLDGQLFQIKHLLILREQITPFQVDFSVKETSLDFSKVRSAAANFLQKRSRLFSFNSNNSLLEFIAQGTPQVTEHFLDSRKDVDNHLKLVCNDLISYCSTLLIEPLKALLDKATVILKVMDEDPGRKISLRNQPFASPEQVGGVVTEANRLLKTKLPGLQRSFSLYLANRETETILFRPVRNSVVASYQQLQEIVRVHYSSEDQVIIGCPSVEQVHVMLSR